MVWGERGEVKHLSTRRKRYSVSSGERKRRMAKPGVCDTWRGLHTGGCGAVLVVCSPADRACSCGVVEQFGMTDRSV